MMVRAWQVRELAGIDGLAPVLIDVPPPGPGAVLVALAATALNHPDWLMLHGRYQFRPALPFVPGMEGVARVVAVGAGVSRGLVGQRMMATARSGLLADMALLPVAALRPAPAAFDDPQAAAFTTGALTAWVALVERARLQRGERLLVLGAGGGMGLAAVALGRSLGADVTAVAGCPAKCAAARAAGARTALEVSRAAPDLSHLRGRFDCVFDPVGGAFVGPALAALGRGGRYLVVGFVGGPPVALATDAIQSAGVEVLGVRAGEAGRRDPALAARALAAIDALAAQGRLRPHVGLDVPFAEARHAFAALGAGSVVGKAVVRMAG